MPAMSQPSDPLNALPASSPQPQPAARPAPAPAPAPRSPGLLGCAFTLSFLANIAAGILIVVLCFGLFFRNLPDDTTTGVLEKHYAGPRTAASKVAIVNIDGVIMEGFINHHLKQIEQAAKDDSVKAVVVSINSPGGSITASDDLHRKITKLRDGDTDKDYPAKPVIVSMGTVAASGGYFIAMPAKKIFAERSTLTGSIGVYISFPNVKKLTDDWGIKMNTIKAGAIKNLGSAFQEITPTEQQVIQDMVDDAYDQFLGVVEKGRPKLDRARLLKRFTIEPLQPDPKAPREAPLTPYTRYRADGGIFTARKARELDLIDSIGTLDDAVVAAAEAAELSPGTYRTIRYQKRLTLSDLLLGAQDRAGKGNLLEIDRLRAVFTPRLWYLAPGYEAVGLLSQAER
jgi:protease-4